MLPLSGVVVVSSPSLSKVMTVGPGFLLVLDRLREVMISFALDAFSQVVSLVPFSFPCGLWVDEKVPMIPAWLASGSIPAPVDIEGCLMYTASSGRGLLSDRLTHVRALGPFVSFIHGSRVLS